LQRSCACGQHSNGGQECDECKQKKALLQRFASSPTSHAEAPPIVHDVLRSSGHPLNLRTRARFQPHFDFDLSQVRVHNGHEASLSALAVNAQAYAVGRDIVFGSEQYQPGTQAGQRLLAHELTHVAQQNGVSAGTGHGNVRIDHNVSHEAEADHVAEQVTTARSAGVQHRTAAVVQRAAPAAAAAGIGALAAKCIIGAIIGVLADLGIQAGIHAFKHGLGHMKEMKVDYCSLIISAVLGCIGGVVAAKWLEPFLNEALGKALGGIAGSLLGKILIFIANKLAIGIPRAMVKKLMHLGCISDEQGEALAPGIKNEPVASSGGPAGAAGEAAG
jgi:hypothetical protein